MRILFEDGVCEDVAAEDEGGFFRLTDTPMSSSTAARLGDVVELASEGTIWRFVRVVEPSPLVTIAFPLAQSVAESPSFARLLDDVRDLGGIWERAYGGMVFVHVPADAADAVRARLAELA